MPAIRAGARGAVISGWGTALPEKVITNDELAATMDTSDEWIRARTGIRERRIGGSTVSLSVESGRRALEMAGLDPARIDALVLSTTTPDKQWGTSAAVQHELGLRCGAFDVNAACSGFVYALVTAHGLIAMGADRVLVLGTDTLSRITDWDDRATAPLFADGSGAVVLESVDGPGQMLGWDLDADGSALPILQAEVGGTIRMEGKEVFRRAVRIMVDSAEKSMAHAGVTGDDIAMIVPHQANIRIIQAACERLGVPLDRASIVIERTGNTSSASIPLALADALERGRVHNGDLLLLVGFGGGMTAASCVLRWGGGLDD
jgi:3-oxoacyl-[acyl-carrier-protein] synthase-3